MSGPRSVFVAVLACLFFLPGGGPGSRAGAPAGEPSATDAGSGEPVARARAAADALSGALMSKLVAELRSGGPVSAIRVCSEVAQKLAGDLSKEGLRVRRVSLKARNEADTPDDFERRTLEWLESGLTAGKDLPKDLSVTFESRGRRELRFLRTIRVAEPCLVCHGEASKIDPGVKKILAERYPADRATGYQAGDLRGAVSVTVALD